MAVPCAVIFHPSQFPAAVAADLQSCWRTHEISPKFHYQSYQQATFWLRLHRAFSPVHRDSQIASLYEQAFSHVSAALAGSRVHLIGLGCGSAEKELCGLKLLSQGSVPIFTAVDVSAPLVLLAAEASRAWVEVASPIVCDFIGADEAVELAGQQTPQDASRLVTFFGMLPNCEPGRVQAVLARLLRPGDCLLLSANLAPGPDYMEGIRRVLPQYDNAATRDWLMLFLNDAGVTLNDGELTWSIEKGSFQNLMRITAWFQFGAAKIVECHGQTFHFDAGEKLRLFYSYRYSSELVGALMSSAGWSLEKSWISASGEEGVFLVALRVKSCP